MIGSGRLSRSFLRKLEVSTVLLSILALLLLHAALVACEVKGGEVLLPALCPAMVAFAVIHAGATPVFCDVDPNTYNLNPEECWN